MFNKQALMYGMITSDGKPKTARNINYGEELIKKVRNPKRGRGAGRKVEIDLESSEEEVKFRRNKLNRSMKAPSVRKRSLNTTTSFMAPTATSKTKVV